MCLELFLHSLLCSVDPLCVLFIYFFQYHVVFILYLCSKTKFDELNDHYLLMTWPSMSETPSAPTKDPELINKCCSIAGHEVSN